MKTIQIQFRGLSLDGKWQYGDFICDPNGCRICYSVDIPPSMSDPGGDTHFYQIHCEIESISHSANKKDKLGKEIFISDIVKIDNDNGELIGEVKQLEGGQIYIDHQHVSLKYQHQCHCEVCDGGEFAFFIDFFDPYQLEIIGNSFENPELITL